jgi:hypothetical protein
MKAHMRLTDRERQYPFPELIQECHVPAGGYDQIKANFPEVRSTPHDLGNFFSSARRYRAMFESINRAAKLEREWNERHAHDMTPGARTRGALIEVV